ncbi:MULTISPECIES: CBS domain-containing protein [unclassified Streptomyces]|uniref:CBS domain-containing protein n=1 Tax=unclassified Streptomyces TaxID=2593676 RepID=UPI0022AF6638|nr:MULTISPECIES: CBS domain-containing protein [unclassified Streptomyces]MCZ4123920.1 CBS domain-containing protein [Streptomyces sp. H39-S7]MDF9814203.1 CBS domain-containing protein [Streptomyces sp. SPB162]
MRARDLAEPYPSIGESDDALAGARLLAEQRLPAVLVLDAYGLPKAILPASQLVRLLVPNYVLEDPTLAAVIDEAHADRLCQALAGRTVGQVLPTGATPPPVADADDTAVEVAALMATSRSPLVAVVEHAADRHGQGRLLGVITASRLLERLLGAV